MIRAYAAQKPGAALELIEFDPGALLPDEVEIAVETCGICHSDLSMLDNEWGFTAYPFVPGHEITGKVAAIGDQVTRVKVGETVGLGWYAGSCMTCHQCMSGNHNLCPSNEGTIVGRHGGFADKVRCREGWALPLPGDLDVKKAGPLFCGGITVFNPLIQFGVKSTDKVAVIGIGGLGHMALMFLNAWGCEVTAFTSSEDKKAEALELGAHHTVDSRDPSAIEAAAGRFDFIISTVNVKLDWNAYVATLKPRGRMHFVGATLDPLDLSLFPLLVGQRSISASPVGSPAIIAKMLDFAVRHDIRPIIETYPFDEVNEAVARLNSGKARYRIVLSR